MRLIAHAREGNMQNPYNQYQSNQAMGAKSAKKNKAVNKKKNRPRPVRSKRSQNKKNQVSPMLLMLSAFGLFSSIYILTYTQDFLDLASRISIGFSQSIAADGEKSANDEAKTASEKETLPVGKATELKSGVSELTMKNTNIFKALKDKQRELEKKERRLAQLEEDLQKQKEEIEKQLKDMQEMRRNISSKLDKKVTADQESIDKLVGVYSNMKPKNAAQIIASIDDELAIKVLGKMKKQNAAAILNFVAPKKAQYLSEKFSGLKK